MPPPNSFPSGAYVLDSHAMLAWLQNQEGGELTEALLKQSGAAISIYLCLINLGEVIYTLERRRGTAHAI